MNSLWKQNQDDVTATIHTLVEFYTQYVGARITTAPARTSYTNALQRFVSSGWPLAALTMLAEDYRGGYVKSAIEARGLAASHMIEIITSAERRFRGLGC